MEIRFEQISKTSRDCSAFYNVLIISDTPITLDDFIKYILNNRPKEWGTIEINDNEIEYKHGKLLSEFEENILNKTVEKVKAHGGYSNMDYQILLN